MDAISVPAVTTFPGDASLAAVLEALRPAGPLPLVLDYQGKNIQAGYHVTEVKAGSFVTIDCGGNPDRWREIVLQVEDLPASPQTPGHMLVKTFLAILDKVTGPLALDDTARLTFEIGPPGAPMQVFDVAALEIENDSALLRLCARPAICKPRHRAEVQAAACRSTAGCC